MDELGKAAKRVIALEIDEFDWFMQVEFCFDTQSYFLVKTVGETALTICVYFQMYENTVLLPKND